MEFELIEKGTITDVPEFLAGSSHCGLKKRSKRDDICIIYTLRDTVTSAVFTTNSFAAAPVTVCREQLARTRNIKAVVVNAGIANACTGRQGYENCLKTLDIASANLGIPAECVMATSTGIIGRQLPMDMIEKGITKSSKKLSPDGGHAAAEAILTTDKIKKEIAVKIGAGEREIIIGGIAKGSGMIEPNMATMLAFIATNADIGKGLLDSLLARSTEDSFNAITVDGCQSTNDMVVVQANGQSGIKIEEGSRYFQAFRDALFYVLEFLAKKIVQDGEGATKMVEIAVEGAKDKHDAKTIAKKVANSNLFKAAVYGQDLNWGRINAAVGASGIDFYPDKVDIYLNDIRIVKDGMADDYDQKAARSYMKAKYISFKVCFNMGNGQARVWTSDLSHDYVSINSMYST
ncbi:MAG: bifunctional glutamate N-acetyltransferase/amino-acid acetyltransferase ArgJ [Actinomycetota bacterium]